MLSAAPLKELQFFFNGRVDAPVTVGVTLSVLGFYVAILATRKIERV